VTLALLGGVFVGALIPFPLPRWMSTAHTRAGGTGHTPALIIASSLFLLAGVWVVSRATDDSLTSCAVGALLLGLLIPSPVREE
jgi:hypothetical protein